MNKRFRMKKRAWKIVFSAQRTLRLGEGQVFFNGKLLGSCQTIVLGSPAKQLYGNCDKAPSIPGLNKPISCTCEVFLDHDELVRVAKAQGAKL